MPILFIHGVNVRDDVNVLNRDERQQTEAHDWPKVCRRLRHYVAPLLSKDADKVPIKRVYWGDLGGDPAWDGASRPRTLLFKQGEEDANAGVLDTPAARAIAAAVIANRLPPVVPSPLTSSPVIVQGPESGGPSGIDSMRLVDLSSDDLEELMLAILDQMPLDGATRDALVRASERVTDDPALHEQLAAHPRNETESTWLAKRISTEYLDEKLRSSGIVPQGSMPADIANLARAFGERLNTVVNRANDIPGFALAAGLLEFRPALHNKLVRFFGDVVEYLSQRGTSAQPGKIPARMLDALAEARVYSEDTHEPVIVLTHSMGGQIVYDLVTYFLPRLPEHARTRIDFWCATASQVGLFEEFKQFLGSNRDHRAAQGKLGFPKSHLGVWWNVWDPTDVLSYTVRDIIDGVDDARYISGKGLLAAHGGYLERRDFFELFAKKVAAARDSDWGRRA